MPLAVFDAVTAFENQAAKGSAWPRSPEEQAKRLSGIAKPSFEPSFRIERTDKIFTVGSCFARNIEAQLAQLDMNVAISDLSFPDDLSVAGDRGTAMLNKFVVHSIENELRWALDPSQPFPEKSLWAMRADKIVDPHLGAGLPPQPMEMVMRRRAIINNWFKCVAECRVIVMTLGLAEAWYDTWTDTYLNIAPPRSIRSTEPGRLQLHVLAYEDIFNSLQRIHALLTTFARKDFRILITVSPGGFGVEFRGTRCARGELLFEVGSKGRRRGVSAGP